SVHFVDGATFNWIGPTLRYGLKNDDIPEYLGIDKQYDVLELAIELDSHELRHASRDELKRLHMVASLKALIHVGRKYRRPYSVFDKMLAELTWDRLLVLAGASLTTHYRNPE